MTSTPSTLAWSKQTTNTFRVPTDYATIQDAVNAASDGDQIRVGPGQWCGATITKQLDLVGEGGATIIGCPDSPNLAGLLRIGFLLPDADATGTSIQHFTFDGRGASNFDFDPLAFAVFARDADDVTIEHNEILGTIQAITSTSGSRWSVNHNKIVDFSVLACDGNFCGGGVGTGNSEGTTLRGNFGVNEINSAISNVTNRSIHTLMEYP